MADPANSNATTDDKNVLKPDEDKVTYNVSISVPDIISALHQKAIVTAQKKAKDIRVVNSAIESDGKKAKLKSAGQHIISVLSTQKDGKVKRSDAIAALKEYVHWFVGPDLESKVTDKVVFSLEKEQAGDTPAADDSQPDGQQSSESSQKALSSPDDEKQLEDKGSVQNALEDKSSGEKKPDEDSQKNESLGTPVFVKSFKDFLVENCGLKFLFEENDLVPVGDNKPAKKEDTSVAKKEEGGALAKREDGGALVPADGQKKDDGDDKGQNDADPEAMGWYIGYNLKVKGLKESKIKDALKQFAAAWFDGITIKSSGLWGSGTVITGKDIRKGIHDLRHVDHEKLAQDVSDYIQKNYSNIKGVDVKARDKDRLLKNLNDAKAKVDANGKKKIAGSAYSLTIKVKEEDPKKPFFNVKKIAEIIKKCMRLDKKHSVDEADVIKVENFKDDNDAQSMSNNATRPTALEMQNIFQHAKDKNKTELSDKKMLSASLALDVFTSISKKFQSLQKNKNANQEKENKRAIELFNDLKKEYEKASKGNANIEYKLFDDFLTKYKKFEAGLGESVSVKIFSKRDVVSLLLESLFDEVPASDIFEADEEDSNLKKATEEDKEGAIDAEFTEVPGDDSKGNEKKDDSRKEVKREEAEPDLKALNGFLKNFAQKQLQTTSTAAVETKDDLISDFKMSYSNDISKIESMKRKYAAVIDMTDKSSLRESLQSLLISMLFEANDDKKRKHDDDNVVDAEFTMKDDTTSSNAPAEGKSTAQDSQDNGKVFKTVQHVFNEFKKKFGIKDEEADDVIVLTQKVEESYASLAGTMLLEADDEKNVDSSIAKKVSALADSVRQIAINFGNAEAAKAKERKNASYRTFNGNQDEVVKQLADKCGIDISNKKKELEKHKYAVAFVVIKDKKDDDTVIHGSTSNGKFTDAAVKKDIFKPAFDKQSLDAKFDLLTVETVSNDAKKMHYNSRTDVKAEVKVFIASFDIDDEKKKKKEDDKKDKEKQQEEKKSSKAYVLPFDFYKDVEEKKDDKDNDGESGSGEESSSGDAGESQTAEKAEGADLYIFPIKSSKMFEETPGNDSK